MPRVLLIGLVVAAAACARELRPPAEGATADEIRAYCRSSTSVARAQDLDRPGQMGVPPPRLAAPRPSDQDYTNCLRRYGVTP